MDLGPMLAGMVKNDASDLYLKSAAPATIRVHGKLQMLDSQPLSAEEIHRIAETLLGSEWSSFSSAKEANLAYIDTAGERYRVNLYYQKGAPGIVFRRVKANIPGIDTLHLPEKLKELSLLQRGLIIISGPTGSGKSTTLAAILEHRNQTQPGHVVTIEDPIEYIFDDKKCLFSQREVGIDTLSFNKALKNALRQAPDIISIGEIRDLETAETALTMAETGHLVFATLHASNTYQTLERLTTLFPGEQEKSLLLTLSLNLRAILSQRLIPTKDHAGRMVATELLLNTPRVKELIRENAIPEIKEYIRNSTDEGMHTFDQSIYRLFEQGIISDADALLFAESDAELKMRMKGFKGVLKQL
ncbi:MAG TPA: PilT/PilU family type 4a pilus ATPase [bacterium]|nr:PilT/PilU family type 4a pilus ATPase [bacterium]